MEEGVLRTGDLIALTLYFLITIGIGVWCTKKSRSTEAFFVGGRSIPGWAVGLSMLGTGISSFTFLAYPGSAFKDDWSLLVPGFMFPIGAFFGAYVFVPFYRSSQFTSAFEYLEDRFGVWARLYGCLLFSVASTWRIGSVLYLLSMAIQALTGWDLITVVVVVGLFVTLYTVAGGIEAVIWTDVLQTLVLIGGGILVILTISFKLEGGVFQVFSTGWFEGKFKLTTDFSPSLVEKTFWVLAISGIIGFVTEFACDQTKVQRYCAAASVKDARFAVWFTGLTIIPMWTLFMFIGTCLFVYYGVFPDPAVGEGMKSDQVFPHFILTVLPTGIGGFVIAGVFAAAMSSIDSSMNATATILTVDVYRRILVRDKTDKHYLFVARLLTAIGGFMMVLTAYLTTLFGVDSLLYIGLVLGSILAGGLGGMYILGFFSTRANGKGIAIGVVSSLMVITYLTLSEIDNILIEAEKDLSSDQTETTLFKDGQAPSAAMDRTLEDQPENEPSKTMQGWRFIPDRWRSPTHPFMIGVFGNLTSFLIGYFASLLFPKPSDKQLDKATWWTLRPD